MSKRTEILIQRRKQAEENSRRENEQVEAPCNESEYDFDYSSEFEQNNLDEIAVEYSSRSRDDSEDNAEKIPPIPGLDPKILDFLKRIGRKSLRRIQEIEITTTKTRIKMPRSFSPSIRKDRQKS